MTVKRGDAFLSGEGFCCVLAVNAARGVVLAQAQTGRQFEARLDQVGAAVAYLEPWRPTGAEA